MLWVLVAAKIVELCGKGKKEKFYAFMRYWGHYSNQYAFFPLSEHKKTYADARNVFSLYVRHWFKGNNYPLKSETRKAMRLDG